MSKTSKTPFQKVNSICRSIANLTDEELTAAKNEILEQVNYTHPLKMGTAAIITAAGRNNMDALRCLIELRDIILRGKR